MNCPSRRATAISPAGRGIRAGYPPWSLSVPPVRGGQSGGPQPVPMIVPAHTTRHGVAAVAGSQAGVAPGRPPTKNRQERNSKPTAYTSIQANRRRTTVVQQSAPAKPRQPNSHTPLNPAILVGHKESQAVCKLHSSSRSITVSVLSKLTNSTITT